MTVETHNITVIDGAPTWPAPMMTKRRSWRGWRASRRYLGS
jgi:hypothetical protein